MRDDVTPPNFGNAPENYGKNYFFRSYRDLEIFLQSVLSKGPLTVSVLNADTIVISGDLAIGGNVTVSGNATVTGDLTVDDITADHITATTAAISTSASIALGSYSSYNGAPISTLVPGSTFGALIEGASTGHLVFGIRANENQDSVSIVTQSTGAAPYDRLVFNARTDGLINIFGQIGFPATQQASAGPNVLDDYEEGTFSPTLSAETTPPTSVTYDASLNIGRYVKVGRNVYIVGRLRTTAVTVGPMAGIVVLGGLPFAISPTHIAGGASFDIGFRAGWTAQGPERGLGLGNTSVFRFYYDNSATGSTTLAPANITATTNDVCFSGWYITDN